MLNYPRSFLKTLSLHPFECGGNAREWIGVGICLHRFSEGLFYAAMSILKSPVFYFGLLLVLVVGAALLAPFIVDWNAYRPQLQTYGHKITGRDVAINGDVAVRLFPWPRLEVEDVQVSGPTDTAGTTFLAAKKITVHLALAGLTSGQIRVEAIDLVGPTLNFAIDQKGQGNWHFKPDQDLSKSGLLANVLLEQINVSDGTLRLNDIKHGWARHWTKVNGVLSGAALEGPWKLKATARDGAVPLDVSVNTMAWKAGQAFKFGFQITPQDGSLPSLAMDGEGDGATFTGKLAVEPVVTADGRTGLSGSFKPLTLQSKFEVIGDKAKLSAIHIVAADPKDNGTLIEGDATVDLARGMKADVHLTAPHIDLDHLAGEQSLRIWQAGGVMAVVNTLMAHFPEEMDVTTSFEANALTMGGENLENVILNGTAAAGALRVQNLEADLPGRSRMKFGGIVFPGPGAAELGGTLAFETGDARAFSQWLWPEGKERVDKIWTGARGRFKSQSDVTWGGKRFGFQNLQYELDGLQGKGDLAVTLGQLPAFNLKLNADQFDLGAYVSGGLGGLASQEGLLSLIPSNGSFEKRVQLAFGKFTLNGVEAQNVALNFDSSVSGFEVKDFSIGSVEGAEVKGNGLVLMGPEGPSGDIKCAIGAQRPLGLMHLLGFLPKGPDPHWTSNLGKTDLHADLNLKPGKDEPQVSFSVTGSSGPYLIVSSGTLQDLSKGDSANLGTSTTLSSPDARDLLRLVGLDPKGQATGDGQLSLTANGNAASGYKTVADLEALGASAVFNGTARPASTGLGLSGDFKLSADEGQVILQTLGFPLATAPLGPMKASATVAAQDEGVAIKSLTFSLAQQVVKGSGRWAKGGVLALDLQGGNFKLADVASVAAAPWTGPGAWPNGSFQQGWPFGLSGEIWLRPASLTDLLGVPLSEAVMGTTNGTDGRAFGLVARRADAGQVKLDVTLKPKGDAQEMKASVRYPFQVEQVFANDGKAIGPSGDAVLDGEFTSLGRSPSALMSGLSGSGTLGLNQAAIAKLAPDPFFAAIKDVKSADEIQHAFAAFTSGGGIDLGKASLSFTVKDGAFTVQPLNLETTEAQVAVSPGADLANGSVSTRVHLASKTQTDFPPMEVIFEGPPGAVTMHAATAELSARLGTVLINKDMAALDKIQKEQEKAALDAAAQAEQDKAKFDAFQSQRAELRLQQRMLRVFAAQRALDASRYKAAIDAAIADGQAQLKDEKRRFLQRLPGR